MTLVGKPEEKSHLQDLGIDEMLSSSLQQVTFVRARLLVQLYPRIHVMH
jgi:hypothetical protein